MYAGGNDTERVEDGPDGADMEEERGCMCMTQESTGAPHYSVERGSSVVERWTRNRVSPGSNPPLVPFRRLGFFVLSIDAPVDVSVHDHFGM